MRPLSLCFPAFVCAIIVFMSSAGNAVGQSVSERFDMLYEYYSTEGNAFHYNVGGLATLDVESPFFHDIFPEGIRIYYDSGIARTINEKFEPYPGEIDPPYYRIRLIRSRLKPDDNTEYFIDFDPGMSADPSFVVTRTDKTTRSRVQMAGGTECMITGDGFIYIHGHTNSMFDMHRRYRVVNDELVEDPQEMYYVGMKTETLEEITLTVRPGFPETAVVIPAGKPVTVLVSYNDRYLILTETGLTGWIGIASGYESPIKHLFFRGD